MSAVTAALADGWVVAKRNLIKIKRIPDLLIFSTIQPIMFVLLFAYVFGGAIIIPGISYREFLMPGIFVQTVAFGAGITAIGLADDLQKGIVDRFRSLPMSRAAVLVGRTTSDLINNIFVVVVMSKWQSPTSGVFPPCVHMSACGVRPLKATSDSMERPGALPGAPMTKVLMLKRVALWTSVSTNSSLVA